MTERGKNEIVTFTGRYVDPLRLQPEDVCIEDIAHALALTCRYGGHSAGHLSVARHSLWVSKYLEGQGADKQMQLWGLLHDAAEAYLGDVVRPMKHGDTAYGAAYLKAESRAEVIIAGVFGLGYPLPLAVREADDYVLRAIELPMRRHDFNEDWREDERWFLRRYKTLTEPDRPFIIGLSGYARSGKDTVGGMLDDYERLAFADSLREMLYALNPLVPRRVGWGVTSVQSLVDSVGWDEAKAWPGVREMLQRLGTEAGRDIHGQDVWVNLAMAKVEPGKRYVITDVRFPNEADAIRRAGGEVWRIDRKGTKPVNPHPSETAMDDYEFDLRITNDGTLDDLRLRVDAALDGLAVA